MYSVFQGYVNCNAVILWVNSLCIDLQNRIQVLFCNIKDIWFLSLNYISLHYKFDLILQYIVKHALKGTSIYQINVNKGQSHFPH
jgi:hypothetical protein